MVCGIIPSAQVSCRDTSASLYRGGTRIRGFTNELFNILQKQCFSARLLVIRQEIIHQSKVKLHTISPSLAHVSSLMTPNKLKDEPGSSLTWNTDWKEFKLPNHTALTTSIFTSQLLSGNSSDYTCLSIPGRACAIGEMANCCTLRAYDWSKRSDVVNCWFWKGFNFRDMACRLPAVQPIIRFSLLI